jgi:hypothetical protein
VGVYMEPRGAVDRKSLGTIVLDYAMCLEEGNIPIPKIWSLSLSAELI